MSNSNKTNSADLNNIKTGWVLAILVGIGLVIVGFFFFNFNSHILKNEGWWKVFQNLSADTGNWGTFGDYVGGILNPVIAAFAFYLIAKTYELQKTELAETRILLEASAKAQKDQIKLAALTASLNSNLTNIGILQSEKSALLSEFVDSPGDKELALSAKFLGNLPFGCSPDNEHYEEFSAEYGSSHAEYESLIKGIKIDKGDYFVWIIERVIEVEREINDLINENNKLKAKIEAFLK